MLVSSQTVLAAAFVTFPLVSPPHSPSPPSASTGGSATGGIEVGDLEDLAGASKGGMDPSGAGSSALATDVLWSDPSCDAGFEPNYSRNIGTVFGPDVTEDFLRSNDLKLVLRSHEGPDARDGRDDMAPMLEGFTLDHETPGAPWFARSLGSTRITALFDLFPSTAPHLFFASPLSCPLPFPLSGPQLAIS